MDSKTITNTVFLVGIVFFSFACSSSKEDQAIEKVAKELGMDKDKLKSKSFYSFKVHGGALDGQEFSVPAYAQGGIDARWDENKELAVSTIGFIDPMQGSSTFRFVWEGEQVRPLEAEANPFGDNSFIELNVKEDEKKYSFLSQTGAFKITSKEKKSLIDDITKESYPVYDLDADFEGDFSDASSGENKILGLSTCMDHNYSMPWNGMAFSKRQNHEKI